MKTRISFALLLASAGVASVFACRQPGQADHVGSYFPAPVKKCTTFTSSGTFTPEVDVSFVDVFAWGGGGGGGAGARGSTYSTAGAGGGGGAGGPAASPSLQMGLAVTPGSACTVTIGAGGTGASATDGGFVTTTTANFTMPTLGFTANLTVTVANSAGFWSGEGVTIPGAGYYVVNAAPLTPTSVVLDPADAVWGNPAQNTVIDAGASIYHLVVPATQGGDTVLTCGSNVYTWAGAGPGGSPLAGYQSTGQSGGAAGGQSRLILGETSYTQIWGGGLSSLGAGSPGTGGGGAHTAGTAQENFNSTGGFPSHDFPRFWAGDGSTPALPPTGTAGLSSSISGGGGGVGGLGGMNPYAGAFAACTPGNGSNGSDAGASSTNPGGQGTGYSNTNTGNGGCGGGGGGGAPAGITAGNGGSAGNGDSGEMTVCRLTAH